MGWATAEDGQGAIELIGAAVALLAVCALALQVLSVGAAWLDAQAAARVAKRAHEVGADGVVSGRRALPPAYRPGGRVWRYGETYQVAIRTNVFGRPIRVEAGGP